MLQDLGWLKQVKIKNSIGTVINPSTNEKLDELKALLQRIDTNTDGLELDVENIELNTDNINLNTDELEAKIDSTNNRLGEVQPSPTQYTVLGRLKDLWDKLVELFNDGNAKLRIIGVNKKVVPTSAFGRFKISQDALLDSIRWTSDLVNEEFDISIIASGNWSIVDTTSLQLETGSAINSGIVITSSSNYKYIPGRGMFIQTSIILGDSGVIGNIREWGLFDDNNGTFVRLNGTQYEFVIRNDGVETVILASAWDVPVSPDANGHSWYIQYQWLGVGNFYLYYDDELVHTYDYSGTKVSIENPDLPLRIRNYNTTNTTNVIIKCGCGAVSIEGINLLYGIDTDKTIRTVKTTSDGRILVSSPPPSAPPDTTETGAVEFGNVAVVHDNIYIIPNGEDITITRFSSGSETDSDTGNVVELYYDPNGDASVLEVIDIIFSSGSSDQHDLDSKYTGNGIRSIRMRRRRLSGGSKEIYGKWEGYY